MKKLIFFALLLSGCAENQTYYYDSVALELINEEIDALAFANQYKNVTFPPPPKLEP